MTTAETGAAVTTDRINFVDEDDARSILLALLEEVAHARSTNAHKHLDKVGTRDRKERYVRFTGNRPGKQSLACSRRAHHQNTFGNTAAELLKLLRFFEEFYDFLQFFLGFFDPGDILKSDSLLLIAEQFCSGFAEGKRLVAA